MIDRFEIIAHAAPRPDAERILFCDGAGGELSHWRPNRTPLRRAGDVSPLVTLTNERARPRQ